MAFNSKLASSEAVSASIYNIFRQHLSLGTMILCFFETICHITWKELSSISILCIKKLFKEAIFSLGLQVEGEAKQNSGRCSLR